MPNVTVKRCTTLNPATLLPTEEDGEEHHCCLSVLEQVCTPRPVLLDTPLENCDNVLFVDGSASKDPQTGLNKVGFAVTTEFEVVKSGKLPSNYSAQGAELVALTEACKLMADKCVHRLCLSFWRPFFYQTRSRSVNAQRTLTIKVLSPQETPEQTRQRRPRQHRREKKRLVLWYLWLTLIFPLVYKVCRLFPQEQKNNNGGRLAAASRGVYGWVLMTFLVCPNTSFSIMLSWHMGWIMCQRGVW